MVRVEVDSRLEHLAIQFELVVEVILVVVVVLVVGLFCLDKLGIGGERIELGERMRINELSARVSREHVDDDHLAPLVHVDEQVAQLPIVFVDQVDALGAHLLERLDGTAGNQLHPTRMIVTLSAPVYTVLSPYNGFVGEQLLNDLDQLVLQIRVEVVQLGDGVRRCLAHVRRHIAHRFFDRQQHYSRYDRHPDA